MKKSLGILLPVYNAQHSLAGGVAKLLDVLPEWSDRFSLYIVDDGSLDDTVEIAYELAACYPQLDIIRHPVRLGLSEAIQTGLDNTSSEIILIGNDAYQLEPEDLRTLWQLRDAERRQSRDERVWQPLPRIGLDQRLGYQSIRRATFEQIRLQHAIDTIARIDAANRAGDARLGPATRPNILGKFKRLAWGE